LAPAILGVNVLVPAPAEYVALGAARQAAWALAGSAAPPSWAAAPAEVFRAAPEPLVRERYGVLRDATVDW
jgi:xylulokinase